MGRYQTSARVELQGGSGSGNLAKFSLYCIVIHFKPAIFDHFWVWTLYFLSTFDEQKYINRTSFDCVCSMVMKAAMLWWCKRFCCISFYFQLQHLSVGPAFWCEFLAHFLLWSECFVLCIDYSLTSQLISSVRYEPFDDRASALQYFIFS